MSGRLLFATFIQHSTLQGDDFALIPEKVINIQTDRRGIAFDSRITNARLYHKN